MFFTQEPFKVNTGRFEVGVSVSFEVDGPFASKPVVYATAVGDARNFVATRGEVTVLFDKAHDNAECSADCQGPVAGFQVQEDWGGTAIATGATMAEAIHNFGIAVAEQVR